MTTGKVNQWTLQFPYERPPLNANQRLHWANKARMTRKVRETTALLARAEKIPPCSRIKVRLLWCVTDKRRRDPSNVVPTQKPMVDGLVDAGIVPDDTPEWVIENMPHVQLVEKGKQGVFLQVIGVPK